MEGGRNSDSDEAPEELTAEQGLEREEEIQRGINENKARVCREAKDRRRQRAQRKTKVNSKVKLEESITEESEAHDEPDLEWTRNTGMLPKKIVDLVASNEKQDFLEPDEREEKTVSVSSKGTRRKRNASGCEAILHKHLPEPPCKQMAMEFLMKRRMAAPRSFAVLKSADQALRRVSRSGLL